MYADHKPSEDEIDRVIGKLNSEYVSLSLLFQSKVCVLI